MTIPLNPLPSPLVGPLKKDFFFAASLSLNCQLLRCKVNSVSFPFWRMVWRDNATPPATVEFNFKLRAEHIFLLIWYQQAVETYQIDKEGHMTVLKFPVENVYILDLRSLKLEQLRFSWKKNKKNIYIHRGLWFYLVFQIMSENYRFWIRFYI